MSEPQRDAMVCPGEWEFLSKFEDVLQNRPSAPREHVAILDRGHEDPGVTDTATSATSTVLPQTHALLEAEIERGLETGVQLSVSRAGLVYEIALGENGAGHPMSSDTVVPWTCSSKPLSTIAFGRAWMDGVVSPDMRVSEVLPEFGTREKEDITIRHLLGHTTGYVDPVLTKDYSQVDASSWDEIEDFIWRVIIDAEMTSRPGSTMSYGPVANWFVLDRMLAAIYNEETGSSSRRTAAELNLSTALGFPADVPEELRATAVAAEGQAEGLAAMELASFFPLPGLSVWGNCGDLRRTGEVFLGHNGYLTAPVLEALRATHWLGRKTRAISETDFPYGMGLMTQQSLFGRRCSHRVFGHAGGNTSCLIVDPQWDLAVGVYWNGRLDNVGTFGRRYALVNALYNDLGIPGADALRPMKSHG